MSDTSKRIIFDNDDGGVSVVIPAPNTGLTLQEVAAKVVPEGKAYEIIDAVDVPNDREFRNAWKRAGKTLSPDLGKAKDIVKDRIREERKEAFALLDTAYLRADEQGDTVTKATIAAKKQALRDAPTHPAIVGAVAVNALKGLKLKDIVP
jgi:hypothetical protein